MVQLNHYWLPWFVWAFIITSPIINPVSAQDSFFNNLYGRALRVEDETPSHMSEKMSLLWMSYLADKEQPSVLVELANQHIKVGEIDQAYPLLQKAFSSSNHDYHTGLLLLSVSGYKEEWAEVERVSHLLLTQRPGDTSVPTRLLQIYQMAGKDSLAIGTLKDMLDKDHNNPILIFHLFDLMVESERYSEAEEIIKNYLISHPGDKAGTSLLVDLHLKKGDLDKAYEISRSLYNGDPVDKTIVNLYVEVLATKGDYQEIEKVIRRFTDSNLATAEDILLLFQTAQQASTDEPQLAALLTPLSIELSDRYPEEEEFQMSRLKLFLASNDTIRAKQEVRLLVKKAAKARPAYDYLINEYIKTNKQDSVAYVVNQGLKSYPKDPAFIYLDIVGDAIKAPKGNEILWDKIDHALTILPEDSPQRIEVSVIKADLLEANDRWEEARILYEKAASFGHIAASNNLAYFLTIYGTDADLPYAEKLSSKVIEADPDNATYLDTYAWILYKRGAYRLAKLYISKAIEQSVDEDHTFWTHYARILMALDEKEEAVRAWIKAGELGADKTEVESELKKLEEE